MQGEAGFYNHTRADYYKLREIIAAQPENAGHAIDDMLLVPELAHAVHHHAAGTASSRKPQLVILHTKGSHYLYSQRYPREFARWTPECLPEQASCSRDELFNAFDNSVLYTDHVLQAVRDTVRDRRALVIYATDHGESIDEQTHFHATPKRIAPPEQFRIPLVFWASDKFLADPVLAQKYARLSAHTARHQPDQAGHHNLFASMLGCIGVDSPNGGITAEYDLCHGAGHGAVTASLFTNTITPTFTP
jgi:KDO II ethanolaminephosphotransferase